MDEKNINNKLNNDINSEEENNFPKDNWKLSEENYILLTKENLCTFIKESKNKPMLLGSKDLRLSLAGAQEKISLAYFLSKVNTLEAHQ